MAASDTILARAEPWLRANLRDVLRAVLPLPVLALAWWVAQMSLDIRAILGLSVYAIYNLVLLVLLRRSDPADHPQLSRGLLGGSALGDAILSGWLLVTAGPLTPAIFPLYVVLTMKALRYRRQFLWVALVPTLLGPFYLAALYFQSRGPVALSPDQIMAYWGLIGGSGFFIGLVLFLGEHRLREAHRLGHELAQLRNAQDARVEELESVNNDLRVRTRRQQALEESLRAINGSLSLDAVLSQILDSLIQMLGTPRVSGAALTLHTDSGFTHRTIALDPEASTAWTEPLARRVVATRAPVVVGDALQERDWRELHQCGALAAISVPLIDPDSVLRGALTVVSSQRYAFTPTEARHLTSFSIQAAVAIHNAELHSAISRQQAMLESVLRDINDSLVVFDEQGKMVLSNPAAYQALQHSDSNDAHLRESLVEIAAALLADDTQMISSEITVGQEGSERYYQAFASLVHLSGQNVRHIAVVLHDITNQKLQERQRVEFISMVSHELRNPLNTLNGFLKVVLQGKAGSLNELQREFLGLADDQAEALKGRITELLEFNRLESGNLRIQPQWGSIADLVLITCARFQVQAEQFGLAITSDVPDILPELLFDSERIGQVLTNLIENAMKATPNGGTITVGSRARGSEVEIYVADTGVGIPADQQHKIFGRFYRLEHKSSKHGAHLGLGLSICQQIVEGHHGRIWVDSHEGQGSRFTFTLPLIHKEQIIGEPVGL